LDFLTQPISQQHKRNINIEENITKNSIFGGANRGKPIMTTTTNNTGTNTMSTRGGGNLST
jgi:hypothetical protein